MNRYAGILFGIIATLAIGCGNNKTTADGGTTTGAEGTTGAANNGGSTGGYQGTSSGGSTGSTAGATGGNTSGNSGGSTGAAASSFSLSLAPSSATIAPGATQAVTVTIARSSGADSVAFTLTSATTGISGTFSPASTALDTTALTVTVAATVPAGSYTANVVGTDSSVTPAVVQTLALPITVTAPATTLLVDNDGYTPPGTDPDISLPIFEGLLNNATPPITFTTYQEPSDGSDLADPTGTALTGVKLVIWFTGDNYGGTSNWGSMSSLQQSTLTAWLNAGGHTLILFTATLNHDWGVDDYSGPETDAFLTLIGEAGDTYNPNVDTTGGNTTTLQAEGATGLVVTGSSTITSFANLAWNLQSAVTSLDFFAEITNPATGVDALATVQSDPLITGTNIATPCIIGYKNMGTAGTSTVVMVSIPFEDIFSPLTGYNDQTDMFTAIRAYAGF